MNDVELSTVFKNLKMDKNIIDTSKAENYIAKIKTIQSNERYNHLEHYAVDTCGIEVLCLQHRWLEEIARFDQAQVKDEQSSINSETLKKLAIEIEKETELICQIEYVIRKIPVRETKHSIHLIVKYLVYMSDNPDLREDYSNIPAFEIDTPLLVFGCVFRYLKYFKDVYLFATNETAVICNLFNELGKKVGLDEVVILIGESKIISQCKLRRYSDVFYDSLSNDKLSPEVSGIITDKCDVDSAVEALLNGEIQPFPLTFIFVQENIYKEFKDIIAWKCKSQENIKPDVEPNCTDAFRYNNKTFYLDYVGNEQIKNVQAQSIFVEAYRTVTELLSLLKKGRKCLCLSLWAGDISEANEIALNVSVPIVWINDYCNFTGPIDISQVIFDKTFGYTEKRYCERSLKQLEQRQKRWMKESFNDRCDKVIEAFEYSEPKFKDNVKDKSIAYWKYNNTFSIEDKIMIMGINYPVPIVRFPDERFDSEEMLNMARSLINGSAVIGRGPDTEGLSCINNVLLEKLEKYGLPVVIAPSHLLDSNIVEVSCRIAYPRVQTKVIWTNFGTAFAN